MNKPVYGTKDAGRLFYKSFRRRAVALGLTEMRLCRSLYAFYDSEGTLKLLMGRSRRRHHVGSEPGLRVHGYRSI